jgi:hypothetical protein
VSRMSSNREGEFDFFENLFQIFLEKWLVFKFKRLFLNLN